MDKLRLAVLISGSGRTLDNLIQLSKTNSLPATIELVVASRQCPGIQFAIDANIPCVVLDENAFRAKTSPDSKKLCAEDEIMYNVALSTQIDMIGVDYVCLAGWVKKLILTSSYKNRVLNIHPSLLPAFGGEGMYGRHVHEAVVNHGCKLSGCTVHLVDEQYDNGPILHQSSTYVTDDDTPETLAARVFELEKEAYPMVIRQLARCKLHVNGRKVIFQKKD